MRYNDTLKFKKTTSLYESPALVYIYLQSNQCWTRKTQMEKAQEDASEDAKRNVMEEYLHHMRG